MLTLRAPVWAKPVRLEAPACAALAGELDARLERTVGSALPDGLEASVAIAASGAGYRVVIVLRDAEQTRGTTAIDAPTCEEAVDAATIVLALALPKTAPPEATPSASKSAVPARAAATLFSSAAPTHGIHRGPAPARVDRRTALDTRSRGSERVTRFALATGVDRGTLPRSTLTLAGAAAHSFGRLELAAIARYGLPLAEERIESGVSESERRDFGSLELRACPGWGQAVRVAACAGTEVGAVRARRVRNGPDSGEVELDQVRPRLSGTLAALLAYRGGLIEPGIELGGAALALGREAGTPWLSVRIAAGAAIAF